MYGCRTPQCDHAQFLQERVVPWLLSQIVSHALIINLIDFVFPVERKVFFQSMQICSSALQGVNRSCHSLEDWSCQQLHNGGFLLWDRLNKVRSKLQNQSSVINPRPFPVHFTQQDLMSSGKDLCDLLLKLQRYYKSARYNHILFLLLLNLCSYQYKIHCRIAEFYMQQIKDEQNCDSVLPDIVATTLTEETSAERKRKMRHRMAKSLQAFHGISMRMLEKESRYIIPF